MVLWIGIDDTDSLQGMCTTFLATEIVRDLTQDFDLIGYPRLVRLNPNIPWKTRGNGAVCIRIGEGEGPGSIVGSIAGRFIVSYRRGRTPQNMEAVAKRVARLVECWSRFEDPTTNPAFVVLGKQPTAGLYWKAVRGVVSKRYARVVSQGRGLMRPYKNGRGLIGALASVAWRPHDRTYEILTYRAREAWATNRQIDPGSVVRMDRAFPSTFNNYDYQTQQVVIAPHSPCPVLFGIRGDDPSILPAAMNLIEGERPERWLIFETNQGTDDHVSGGPPFGSWSTVRWSGAVQSLPRILPGGHVVVRVANLDFTAYEPSKQFRSVVRKLVPGDRVQAVGAMRRRPRTLNLEKLLVESTVDVPQKVANPWCSRCQKRAKSMGHQAGFRCVRCGKRFPVSAAIFAQIGRGLLPGWYEPPVFARRHLSKPLKRMHPKFTRDRVAQNELQKEPSVGVPPLPVQESVSRAREK